MNKYYLIKGFYSKKYLVRIHDDMYELAGTKYSATRFETMEEVEDVMKGRKETFEIKTIYV